MSQETSDISNSPARRTRLQEKEELAYLNDRFATYIEQVRNLKESNLRYEYELKTTKDQVGRETEDVKRLFEAELSDARSLIDETAREKARQQLLATKNASRVTELETEVKELKDELDSMKTRVTFAEKNANSMDAQRKSTLADMAALQKKLKEYETEMIEMRATMEELRAALETETLSKVDYQNNVQSLNEDLAFRKKVYEEELMMLRSKSMQSTFTETYDFAQDGHLETAIDELRERSDLDIADYKSMLDAAYRDKITKLEQQTGRDSSTIAQLNIDIRKLTGSMTESKNEIPRLQKEIEKLNGQLDFKDDEMSRMTQKHSAEVARLSTDLRSLRESYEIKIKEYENLMDLKIQLDQEIATYRALLQEEENRLNLTPTPRGEKRRSRTQSTEQMLKKQRVDTPIVTPMQQEKSSVSSSAAGCIQICDVDAAGRYVQIKNMSDSAESVGGFKITHDADEEDEINFKFHPKSKLQGGASVTVWGSDANGAIHNPPHDIIWRNQPVWGAGSNTITKLISKTSEVVATFTQRSEISPAKPGYSSIDVGTSVHSFPYLSDSTTEKDSPSKLSRMSASTTRTTTYGGSAKRVGEEHMFHQQGDPQETGDKSCVIS